MIQIYYGYILHSKSFPTTPHTPKSELKRRRYCPDKLDKVFCRTVENYVATKFSTATKKLCHDIENYVARWFSTTTKKLRRDIVFCCNRETMSRHRKLCRNIVFCCNRKIISRHSFLCCDIVFCCNIANYVVTEKNCVVT